MDTPATAPRQPGDPSTSSDQRNPMPITTENGRRELVRQNPAVSQEGWANAPGISERLDEAAELHDQAVRDLADARKAAQTLGQKFKAEDEQRTEAYKTGLTVPEMTDPAERQAAVTDARPRVEAAQSRLEDFAGNVVGLVQDNEEAWLGDVAGQKAKAAEQIAEAERIMAAAHQAMGEAERNAAWIKRTAANLPGWHISIDLLGVPTPPEMPDLRHLAGTDL